MLCSSPKTNSGLSHQGSGFLRAPLKREKGHAKTLNVRLSAIQRRRRKTAASMPANPPALAATIATISSSNEYWMSKKPTSPLSQPPTSALNADATSAFLATGPSRLSPGASKAPSQHAQIAAAPAPTPAQIAMKSASRSWGVAVRGAESKISARQPQKNKSDNANNHASDVA